jgi:hypothetical protein
MRKLKINICEVLILLLHKNIKVRVNFTFFEAGLVNLEVIYEVELKFIK